VEGHGHGLDPCALMFMQRVDNDDAVRIKSLLTFSFPPLSKSKAIKSFNNENLNFHSASVALERTCYGFHHISCL
jgi:hypothetical protein